MLNTKFLVFSFTLLLLCLSCNNSNPSATAEQAKIKPAKVRTSILFPENNNWITYLNAGSDSLANLYAEDAVKILVDGTILSGQTAIKDYLHGALPKINAIQSDTIILAHQERALSYELGVFTDVDQKKYQHLIIWQVQDAASVRVFEFVAPQLEAVESYEELEERRALWMELCNRHEVKQLIYNLYAEETLYFNHRPLLKGRAALVKAYQYMKDENYQLSLWPIVVRQVSPDFIFEIGQCAGSYQGKYILIWQRTEEGQWNIFIDSNI
ncbi:MAG: hypothetical protein AB8G15_13050 [Saprospiraceae bacterium]